MRSLFVLLALFVATAAYGQQRQPAQITTLPTTNPQEFDLLDNQGNWVPLGAAADGAFTVSGSAGTDVRQFGCVADGVTDQAACINNAITKAPGCVIIPPSQNGFYVAPGSTINAGKCLKGAAPSVTVYYNSFPGSFAGRAWIRCGTSTTSVCVTSSTDGNFISDLTIAASYPPAVGSIGLKTVGSANSQYRNVNVAGFDQCAYWLSSGVSGLSSHIFGLYLDWCQTYEIVQDGWPELTITDGRWSAAGTIAAYPTPKAAIYITHTQHGGAGAGPNTLVLTNVQVNSQYVGCMVLWGGYQNLDGGQRIWKFIGDHFEFLGVYPGNPANKRGVFCSDSTVPAITELYTTDSTFTFDNAGGGGVFNLDPATNLAMAGINNSWFGGDGTTLVLPTGGLAGNANRFTNSYFNGPTTITGDASQYFNSSNNIFGVLTLNGTWGRFTSSFDTTTNFIESAARGNIFIVGARAQLWTPVITFGGTPSTLAWATSGQVTRTATGGFTATFSINGPGTGTEGSTGNVAITGLPYKCVNFWTGAPLWTANLMAGHADYYHSIRQF